MAAAGFFARVSLYSLTVTPASLAAALIFFLASAALADAAVLATAFVFWCFFRAALLISEPWV